MRNIYYGIFKPYIMWRKCQCFTQRHFDTEQFSSFTDAIDNGQVVLTDINSEISNTRHIVAVVGYHPDGTLIYMDPEIGTLQEGQGTDFGLHYAISISGCK